MLPKNVRLTGRNPLAYLGVDPVTPPLLLIEKRSPTANDYSNVDIGAIWVVSDDNTQTYEYWVLVNIDGGSAHWVQLYPGASGGATSIPADNGTATVASGVLKIFGGDNITTYGSGNEIDVQLDDSVSVKTALTVQALGAGVVMTDSNGRFSSTDGNDGMVLIGNTNGAPEWAQLTPGANVSITNGANSITISASGGGGGGDLTFAGDTGTALANAGTIKINGDGVSITTTASGTGASAQVAIGISSTPTFTTISTGDLTVTGQPTFNTFEQGVIVSSPSGVLSYLTPTSNGQVLIANGNAAVWNRLEAGSGVSMTYAPGRTVISASGGGSSTTFTGNTGSVTPTGTLKIIGDGTNVITTASGSGSSAQVLVNIAATPTFTNINTTSITTKDITATGTLTLTNLTSGILKASGTGAVVASTPSANGQILIASSTGATSWGTITGVGTVSVTNGANSITITGTATTRTWTKITTLFGGAPITDMCVMQNYFVAIADRHIAYSTDPATSGSWHSSTYASASKMRSCCTDGTYIVIAAVQSDNSVAFYYTTNPTYGWTLNQMSSSWHSSITPRVGRCTVGFLFHAGSNHTNTMVYGQSSAMPFGGSIIGSYALYNPSGTPTLDIVSSSYGAYVTGFIASNGYTYTQANGTSDPLLGTLMSDTHYKRVFYSPKSNLVAQYANANTFFTTTSTANSIFEFGKGSFPTGATVYALTSDGNTFMGGGTAFYKSTDLNTFTALSASGGTIPGGGITAMTNAGGVWVAGDAAGQIWVLSE